MGPCGRHPIWIDEGLQFRSLHSTIPSASLPAHSLTLVPIAWRQKKWSKRLSSACLNKRYKRLSNPGERDPAAGGLIFLQRCRGNEGLSYDALPGNPTECV